MHVARARRSPSRWRPSSSSRATNDYDPPWLLRGGYSALSLVSAVLVLSLLVPNRLTSALGLAAAGRDRRGQLLDLPHPLAGDPDPTPDRVGSRRWALVAVKVAAAGPGDRAPSRDRTTAASGARAQPNGGGRLAHRDRRRDRARARAAVIVARSAGACSSQLRSGRSCCALRVRTRATLRRRSEVASSTRRATDRSPATGSARSSPTASCSPPPTSSRAIYARLEVDGRPAVVVGLRRNRSRARGRETSSAERSRLPVDGSTRSRTLRRHRRGLPAVTIVTADGLLATTIVRVVTLRVDDISDDTVHERGRSNSTRRRPGRQRIARHRRRRRPGRRGRAPSTDEPECRTRARSAAAEPRDQALTRTTTTESAVRAGPLARAAACT